MTTMKTTAKMLQSPEGTSRPTLLVQASKRTTHRELRAKLFELAAVVELASGTARWIVQVAESSLYLELSEGTTEEAKAGLKLLSQVASGARPMLRGDGTQVWVSVPD